MKHILEGFAVSYTIGSFVIILWFVVAQLRRRRK
jgi:hypothetical protein